MIEGGILSDVFFVYLKIRKLSLILAMGSAEVVNAVFSLSFTESCFQFPLQVNRISAAIRRKKKENDGTATDDDDNQSAKSSRDPETFFTYTSSGTSEIESPSFVPVMSVHPPTPTGSVPSPSEHAFPASTSEQQISRKSPPLKSSSLDDMSRSSKNARDESESLIKAVASISPASNPGNMLYIPEIKGRLSAAVSESSLWNSRNKPWLDGTNMDFRGSTLITSQGLQQLVHPRKTEKVAQVYLRILLFEMSVVKIRFPAWPWALMEFWYLKGGRLFYFFILTSLKCRNYKP